MLYFQYQNQDTKVIGVDVMICDYLYKSYNYQLLPFIKEFEGLLNENGGNVTLIGNNLISIYNVTGFLNNVICYLPSFMESGTIGYDIPLTINIDGKYTSNTIKVSFNQTETPSNQTETPSNQTETPFNQTETPFNQNYIPSKPYTSQGNET
ncbi:hypothetical protein ACTFIR_002943 [Dictyostelium discoideum]